MTPEEIADLAHLRRARDLMDRGYAQPLDVPVMTRAALMSPAQFSRKFRAAYGETPYSYLMTRRDTAAVPRPQLQPPRGHPAVCEQGRDAPAAHARDGLTTSGDRAATPSRIEEASTDRCSYSRRHDSHRLHDVHPRPRPGRGARLLPRRARPRSQDGRLVRWLPLGHRRGAGQDVVIVLFQPHGGRSQTEGDALLSLVTQGSLQAAIFQSDDLDTTFEKVRKSGAEVLQEPASQPWAARDCAFRDPSGNLVRIAQA